MNPFMLQHSQVVHDERIRNAEYARYVNEMGTAPSQVSSNLLSKINQTLVSFGQRLQVRTQITTAHSSSRLGQS